MNRNSTSLSLLAAGLLLAQGASAALEVELQLPTEPVQAGSVIDVPVYIRDDADDVKGYTLQLRFSPGKFRVLEIQGGLFQGFSDDPVSDPDSYASGVTSFNAVNEGGLATPDQYEAARIRLEVIGLPGERGRISLVNQGGDGLVVGRNYRLTPAALLGGGGVTIDDTGVTNLRPVADAGSVMTTDVGEPVTLSAASSYDPDGDAGQLTYEWSLRSQPGASAMTHTALSGDRNRELTFTPDAPGIYRFRVEVSDGRDRDWDRVMVKVRGARK